jgi:hypothetical protein
MDPEWWMYLLEVCEDLRPVLCIAAQQVRNPANQPPGRKLSVKDDMIYHYKKVVRQVYVSDKFCRKS